MPSGYSPEEIFNVFKEYSKNIKYIEIKNILKLIYGILIERKIIIKGLNSGNIIKDIINKKCKEKGIKNINEIKMPLLIPTVDLHTGKIYCFCSQEIRGKILDNIIYENYINVGNAVQASCSYPLVFEPCKFNNYELIDGGIRENVPWKETMKMGADKVISVVFQKDLLENCCTNIIDVVDNSLNILKHELSNYELLGTDYLIKIKTKNIGLLDTSKIDELYELGYKTAKKQITHIKKEIYK